jgi:hypothetical protein
MAGRSRSRSRSGDNEFPKRFEGSVDYNEILFDDFPDWRKDLSVFQVLASCLTPNVDVVSYRFNDERSFQFVLKHANGVERLIQFLSLFHRSRIEGKYVTLKTTRITDKRVEVPFQLSPENVLTAIQDIHRIVYKFINILVAEGKIDDLRVFNVASNATNKDMGPVSQAVLQFVKGSFKKDPIRSRF